MKNSTAYALFIVLLLGIALWSQVSRPRRFVWMPTYSHYDTQPFGCAVFDSVLSFSLPQGYEVINKPLFVLGREDTARVRNILVVSNGVELGMNERDTLFRMLERGAKVMLVATWIDSDLEDTLGVHFAMQEFSDVVSEGTELLPPCDTLCWAGGAGGYPERRFIVRSDFGDLALIHDNNTVGIANCGKTVCHNKGRTSFHQRLQRLLNVSFAFRIQSARCFVKKQNLGVLKERTSNGNTLTLSAAQTVAGIADLRVQAVGQRGKPIGQSRGFRSTLDLFARHFVFATVRDVPGNGVVENDDFLTHQCDLRSQ